MKILPVLIALLWATTADAKGRSPDGKGESGPRKAAVTLAPTVGHNVSGRVEFVQQEGSVLVTATVEGLSPGTTHGFHIHEIGSCAAPDASSAGDHFNPAESPHGAPDAAMRHAGDLGNLKADMTGVATLRREDDIIQLTGPRSIVGRSVIVHADPDDLTTQPSGNAGGRIACGVIVELSD
jgi:superoxide dismutase, Cu-Zn family